MPIYDLPHINIGHRRLRRDYQDRSRPIGDRGPPRVPAEHGARIRQQFLDALRAADETQPAHPSLPPPEGTYLEVELVPGKHPEETLERKRSHIRAGAVNAAANDADVVVLYVPDAARSVFQDMLDAYANGELTPGGNPRHKGFVEPIEDIRQAFLSTFWTDDPNTLPQDPQAEIWWEVWCFPDSVASICDLLGAIGGRCADEDLWMRFPEAVVVPTFAKREAIELLLVAPFGLLELRRASADPTFFTDENRAEQTQWTEDLAERILWPGTDVPAVCLFDTGVNRAHSLIEPALSTTDLLAVEVWGGDDSEGHGTQMAGLILHGDLTPRLSDLGVHPLEHRMESVKLLPPPGFEENPRHSLGAITQSAVALSEINLPDRRRVFCMAITNKDVSGARSSTWSAAIDQAAAGAMDGDEEVAPKRLFILAAGNVPAEIERHRLLPQEDYPIEDPAQSWNAITVGGYTDRLDVTDPGLEEYAPLAEVGDLSPHSRTSQAWIHGKAPYKPDIVMEAGNRAISPDEQEVYSAESLSLLSTGPDVDRIPLCTFQATSAAAAQGARLAARLMAQFPDFWPETIRALIVHSAQWTPTMRNQLDAQTGMRSRYSLLRRFGYGVPSYDRAAASAQSHLALVSEATIQPFVRGRFKDCHFYSLPWPRDILQEMGETRVRLKLTLSYFVQPNPGGSASLNPRRYQSFGLRFDLKRSLETREQFVKRINNKEIADGEARTQSVAEDGGWTFGPRSVSAGSLHSDEWVGTAATLANRDLLCVRPVVGWWRDRAARATAEQQARYALVITLQSEDVTADLHTGIENMVNTAIDIEIPVRAE